jgi:hypothetical protein
MYKYTENMQTSQGYIFCIVYNISEPNFAILLILISSLREFTFFCLNQKLV